MYTLTNFCFICLSAKKKLINLLGVENSDTVQQVKYAVPELHEISELEVSVFICSTCHKQFLTFYKFKKMCFKNYLRFRDYIKLLKGTNCPQMQRFGELQISFSHNKLLKRKPVKRQNIVLNIKEEIIDLLSDEEIDIEDLLQFDEPEEVSLLLSPKIDEFEEPLPEIETEIVEPKTENIEDVSDKAEDTLILHAPQEQNEIEESLQSSEKPKETKDSFLRALLLTKIQDKIEERSSKKSKINEDSSKLAIYKDYIEKQLLLFEKPKDIEVSSQVSEEEDDIEKQLASFENSDEFEENLEELPSKKFKQIENISELSEPEEHDDIEKQLASFESPDKFKDLSSKKPREIQVSSQLFEEQDDIEKQLQSFENPDEFEELPSKKPKQIEDSLQLFEEQDDIEKQLASFENPDEFKDPLKISKEQVDNADHLSSVEQNLQSTFVPNDVVDQESLLVQIKCEPDLENLQNGDDESFPPNENEAYSENEIDNDSDTSNKVKELECLVCHKKMKQKKRLILHLKRHAGIRDFPCTLCEKKFVDITYLKTHMIEIHQGIKNFKCDICNMRFAVRQRLTTHMKVHQDVRNLYDCKICHKQFTEDYSLKKHLTLHDREKRFECRICNEKFALRDCLNKHMQTHKEEIKCSVCQQEFRFRSELKLHQKIHKIEPDPVCTICNKRFASKNAWLSHKYRIHSNGPKIYSCELCGKNFRREYHLTRHLEMHNRKKYECKVCNQKFTERAFLSKHTRTHEEDVKCCACQQKFRYPGELRIHKKSHIIEYVCTMCNKIFFFEKTLQNHISRFHSPKAPADNTCRVCRKNFQDKYALKKHMKIHLDIKDHECPICKKRFREKFTLKGHMNTHYDIKTFVCTICHKRFRLRSTLYSHMILHNTNLKTLDNVTNYDCVRCGEKFTLESDLQSHMHKHSNTIASECTSYECEKKYTLKPDLEAHMHEHLGTSDSECTDTATSYECIICGKKYTLKSDLEQHMNSHGGVIKLNSNWVEQERNVPIFECLVCNVQFVSEELLKQHIITCINNFSSLIDSEDFTEINGVSTHLTNQ